MEIRKETPDDISAIRALTKDAFAPMPFSDGKEPDVIDALRKHQQLTLSLVAVQDRDIVGQVSFSPVTIDGTHDHWFGLGPVSIRPDRQKQGIGSTLIRKGLALIKYDGAKGCVLVGDPGYYSRFGFSNKTGLNYANLDGNYIQRVTFVEPSRDGTLLYSPAFEQAASG